MKYQNMDRDLAIADIDKRLDKLENPVDYYAEYRDLEDRHRILRNVIKEALKALEPWYLEGKVGSPMDAVNALKAIASAVNS